MKKKVLSVFGTRPEAIKMAPVVQALAREEGIESRICVTGQHREMLDQVLSLFELRPDHDLKAMRERQTLSGLSAIIMSGLDELLSCWTPDMLLVHGDTTTTFSAALAAFHRKVPVGHVEAGLRTGTIHSPWPEEANRRLTGCIAELHFAPTARNRDNLLAEGVAGERISVTGNTVIDALHAMRNRLRSDEGLREGLGQRFSFIEPGRPVALVTGHRRENFGPAFEQVCMALRDIAAAGTQVIYPVHLNPAVREPVHRILGGERNITLLEPLEYLPFVYLMDRCDLVVTDSGGIQEEAPALGRPVLVTRDTTERPEAVDAGTVRLVGTDRATIRDAASALLADRALYDGMARAINPYGDGRAASRIVERILYG